MSAMLSAFRTAGFPGRYIQGSGALELLGEVARDLAASSLLMVCDDTVDRLLGESLRSRLSASGMPARRLAFRGECTRAEIEARVAEARQGGSGAVVAMGGGKAIDTGKGVAKALSAPLIVAPTVASNDSATSRLIVLYDDRHRLAGVDLLPRNPDVVLVDSLQISRAPLRFFRAGMGDALSKRFEAAQTLAAGGLNFHGGRPPAVAALFADRCYAVIRDQGPSAVAAVREGNLDESVEAVIEATVLLSGIGFETGGLSLAHALLRGLSAIPALASSLHGEAVAFGTVTQILVECDRGQRAPAVLEEFLVLLERIGLRVSLESLGHGQLSADELAQVVATTLAAPYAAHFPPGTDADVLGQAILKADALLRNRGTRSAA